jgi:hypothetical protein
VRVRFEMTSALPRKSVSFRRGRVAMTRRAARPTRRVHHAVRPLLRRKVAPSQALQRRAHSPRVTAEPSPLRAAPAGVLRDVGG